MTARISALVTQALAAAPLSDFQQEWDANIRPNPYISLPGAPYEQLARLTETSQIRLASLHRLSFSVLGENFEFAAAGRLWTVPKALQPALAKLRNGRVLRVADLAEGACRPPARSDLFKSLTVLAQAGVVLVTKG